MARGRAAPARAAGLPSATTRTGKLEVTKQAVKAGSVRKANTKIAFALGRTGPAPTPRFTG